MQHMSSALQSRRRGMYVACSRFMLTHAQMIMGSRHARASRVAPSRPAQRALPAVRCRLLLIVELPCLQPACTQPYRCSHSQG